MTPGLQAKAVQVWERALSALRALREALRRSPRLRRRSGREPHEVVVWERTPDGWKCLEGEIGGSRPRILRARLLPAEPGAQAPRAEGGRGAARQAILVVGSRRFVCRELEMPAASPDEIGQMVALRLETELPYELAEATWAHQLQGAGAGQDSSKVLLVAVPSEDIAAAERELPSTGRPCQAVESCEGALAQAAVLLAPGADTAAIVAIGPASAVMVVTNRGRMSYARTLAASAEADDPSSAAARVSRLASEVDQSLQHYALRAGEGPPKRLMIVGEPKPAAQLAEALAERATPPAEVPEPPEELRCSEAGGDPKETLVRFASCMGALVAAHRRFRGEQTAAPPLRMLGRRADEPAFSRVLRLAALNLLLLVAVAASAFGVRAARLHAATAAVKDGKPLLHQAEMLEEEVRILSQESERHRCVLDLFLTLTEAMPKGVEIRDLTIDAKGNVIILGKAPSIEAASKAVSELVDSGEFVDAALGRSAQEKEGLMFRVTCVVR